MDLQLIDPVPAVLEEVEETTGKRIEFIPRENLPVCAMLRMAREKMPAHLIYYRSEHDEIIDHVILHQCGHLLRIFRAPENQRRSLYSDQEIRYAALRTIRNELSPWTPDFPERRISPAINRWYGALLRQLANLPPNLMIEKWIHERFPAFRRLQSRSIKKQYEASIADLTDAVGTTPATALAARKVMHHAFFRVLGRHLAEDFIGKENTGAHLTRGERLAAITEKEVEDSHEGDNRMIDRWAAFLNLSGWYKWRGFEDVPPDYSNTF